MIRAVIFDFGGVLAEEGFREGMRAIALKNGLDPDVFFHAADDLIYETGYLIGMSNETSYWKALRERTGISGGDHALREEILSRFILRPRMLGHVRKLKSAGMITAILSDQTNWLAELDRKTPFYDCFDRVFNSFEIKKSKKDPSTFTDICAALGIRPDETIFVDDNPGHVKRAADRGLHVIHFRDIDPFENDIGQLVG